MLKLTILRVLMSLKAKKKNSFRVRIVRVNVQSVLHRSLSTPQPCLQTQHSLFDLTLRQIGTYQVVKYTLPLHINRSIIQSSGVGLTDKTLKNLNIAALDFTWLLHFCP